MERTDITGQCWSLLETGRERGSVSTYLQIAAALDLTLDDLFYDGIEALRTEKTLLQGDILAGCTAGEQQIISETVHALKAALKRARER